MKDKRRKQQYELRFSVRASKQQKTKGNSQSRLDMGFLKINELNCGAEQHHYSMFSVGRSMFDVQSVRRSSFPTTP
jgi:hypothetical protein